MMPIGLRCSRATLRMGFFFLLGGGALLIAPSGEAEAQSRTLRWTEVTRYEAPGALGATLSLMGGLGESRSDRALRIEGSLLRRDDGTSSTIFDLEGRRFIVVDHEEKSYTEISFDQSAELAEEMSSVLSEARAGVTEAMQDAQQEMSAAQAEMRRAMEEAQANASFRLTTDALGEQRRFGSYSAERFRITARLSGGMGAMGRAGSEDGELVVIADLWQSLDFPTEDQFFEAFAAEFASDPATARVAEAFEGVGEDLSLDMEAMFSTLSPGLTGGLSEVRRAIESLEGTTVESRIVAATLTGGAQLDADAVLNWETTSAGEAVGSLAREAARETAAEAARGAVRGLSRGLLGRGGGGSATPAPAQSGAPAVSPLLRIVSLFENISLSEGGAGAGAGGTILQELGEYRAVSFESLMGGVPR
jgi:hypothetical protein